MKARDRIINALKGAGFTPADCEDAVEALERIAEHRTLCPPLGSEAESLEMLVISDTANGDFE